MDAWLSHRSGRTLWLLARLGVTSAVVGVNLIGAVAVIVISFLVLPVPHFVNRTHTRIVDGSVAGGYAILAAIVGTYIGTRGLRRLRDWLLANREATLDEQRLFLRAPLRIFWVQVGCWMVAAVLFGVLDGIHQTLLGERVAITVAITGLVTASFAYQFMERIIRPGAMRAFADGPPQGVRVPGVAGRALLAWGTGSGLPALGLVMIGVLALVGDPDSRTQLGLVMVTLGGVVVAIGLLSVSRAAVATVEPLESVRRGMEQIQSGHFDVKVPVYDSTQIGQLQHGFNQMAAGLAERERIREVFGTYVDPEVAEHILEAGTQLSGEEVEVSVLFMDVRGFTSFSETHPPAVVVESLNKLFEAVVPVIQAHGGRVDKFIGDCIMAVFGAPVRYNDHALRAVQAGMEMARRVESGEAGDLRIGIGINSGQVVAGNLGGGGRYEFSVIGDTVNVAARVESTTRQTGDTVLIAQRTEELLDDAVGLVERPEVPLKGKTETVRLYAPALPA